MTQAMLRNAIIFLGMVLLAIGGAAASNALVSPRGALAPAVLAAESPARATVAVLVLAVIGTLVAAGVARMINAAVGLFVLGFGLSIMALRTAPLTEVIFTGGAMTGIAAETALWSLLLLGMTLVVFRLGGPLPDVRPGDDDGPPRLLGQASLAGAAAGLLMLPAVWIIAQTPMKGQAYGAVFAGATVAGLVGRLVAPHVQPVLLFASPCLAGAIGHLIGARLLGGSTLETAFLDGTIPSLCRPMPIDFAAGTLTGVAFGLGWAKSFLHGDAEHEPADAKIAGAP